MAKDNYVKEWDEDSAGFLDTDEFKDYCTEVRLAVQTLGNATQSNIKRRVIARVSEDYFAAALSSLQATGLIQAVLSGSLTRWTATEPPKPKVKKAWSGFNSEKAPKPILPDGKILYGDKSLY